MSNTPLNTDTGHPIPIFLFPQKNRWYPLSIGMLQAYIEQSNLAPYFRFYHPAYNLLPFFLEKIIQANPSGIWLFSNYIWNVEDQLRYSKKVKEISPKSITIHGGPSTPKYPQACEAFLKEHDHIDIVVHGEGEVTLHMLLSQIVKHTHFNNLPEIVKHVAGISYLDNNKQFHKNTSQPRITDLNTLPSPYLTGVFNAKPEAWENQYKHAGSAILETNRGCPYKCTFCDWGSLTQQKIKQFELTRVKAELDWMATHQVADIFIADANFGIFERDVEIAQYIADVKKKTGYPTEVIVNYAKNATERIAKITKIWLEAGLTSQGVISIQTSDEETLKAVKRDNIKTHKYDELAVKFDQMGLPLSTDLMIGLPGATMTSFKADLQRYFDKNIHVKAYTTVMLPNSPMADPEYVSEYKIVVDAQQRLIATVSYTTKEWLLMHKIYEYYSLFELFAYLRYILRFLQWEYQIPAIEVIHQLALQELPQIEAFVKATFSRSQLLEISTSSSDLLYKEVIAFLQQTYPQTISKELYTVVQFNQMIIPHKNRDYPLTLELEHDFVNYCHGQKKWAGKKSLERIC